MKIKVIGFIEFLAIVFIIGTVGACECNNISFTQTVIQLVIGSVVTIICHRILYLDWERRGNDYEENL